MRMAMMAITTKSERRREKREDVAIQAKNPYIEWRCCGVAVAVAKAISAVALAVTGPGRGAVWLARLNGVQEVAGSNPVAPT
jgi:hypothetical protein